MIYDYRQNRQFLDHRRQAENQSRRLRIQLDRDQYLDTVERQAREFAADQNISLIMHEAAHQLSFNGGLLSRDGDAPFWVVEGLACYCESSENGHWLGLGKPNPDRRRALERARGRLPPLQAIVSGDGWKGSMQQTLLCYAQSWALFQMLMEERPLALRQYLKLIYSRATPDHRLTDFQQAFGAIDAVEKKLQAYVEQIIQR